MGKISISDDLLRKIDIAKPKSVSAERYVADAILQKLMSCEPDGVRDEMGQNVGLERLNVGRKSSHSRIQSIAFTVHQDA